jgi:hypothetical protein
MFSMFVVDLMHDFELGEWRAIFIHLLRILESVDANLLTELDRQCVFSAMLSCFFLIHQLRQLSGRAIIW